MLRHAHASEARDRRTVELEVCMLINMDETMIREQARLRAENYAMPQVVGWDVRRADLPQHGGYRLCGNAWPSLATGFGVLGGLSVDLPTMMDGSLELLDESNVILLEVECLFYERFKNDLIEVRRAFSEEPFDPVPIYLPTLSPLALDQRIFLGYDVANSWTNAEMWPDQEQSFLPLDGFSYGSLLNSVRDAREWLAFHYLWREDQEFHIFALYAYTKNVRQLLEI